MLYPILISYKYTYISHCELSHLHPLYVIHSFSTFCFFTQKNKGIFFFFFNFFQVRNSAAQGLCSRLSSQLVAEDSAVRALHNHSDWALRG